MNITPIKPDVLFECSWEVCNKVGGIYTVLSTKYEAARNDLGNRYIFIGPDVWKETRENPDFLEDKSIFRSWIQRAEKEGLRLRAGRWNIPGQPVALLVDFTTLFPEKDKIFASLWETYKLDSLSGGWDYVEPALFGYAAGMVVESFYNFYLGSHDRIIAHFHEWMTGAGILYLEHKVPQVGTVFTTHATTLGRSITGNELPLYSELDRIIPEEMARKLGVISKHSLEMNAARVADSFTTVSEITAGECKAFFGREDIIITPNGFSSSFVPSSDEFEKKRVQAREKIIDVASALLNQQVDENSMIVLTSGRYEFRNKGLDAFIDAIGKVNQSGETNRKILAIVAVPGHHGGPRKELLDRIESPDYSNPLSNEYLTHLLHDRFHDPVINRILTNNLNNGSKSLVKIMFIPVYLDGFDGIFNMSYYDFLNGCDLTIFPSLYEPWGYTPLESIAFGIPTITTNLAGFGVWVEANYKTPEKSVNVVTREDSNFDAVVNDIAGLIRHFANSDDKALEATRKEARDIAEQLLWKHLVDRYWKAYRDAFGSVSKRPEKLEQKSTPELTSVDVNIQDTPNWKKFFVKTSIPPELEPLKEMSMNLWWCWNTDAEMLFRETDPELWQETESNPVALLNRLSYDKLQKLKENKDFMDRMGKVYSEFRAYMDAGSERPQESVGYFSMEFGLHESIKIYSGGLGILAGDYLKEASDSNKNMVGVGLLYRYGYFNQSISIFGDQDAQSRPQKYTDLPLVPVRDQDGNWVTISLALPGRTLYAKAWKLAVGRIDLYLLDTDIEENTMEDRSITHHLYGGDWHNRFKQELVLGVGGVRLLYTLNMRPTIYHLNEGHAAFAGLERLRHMVEDMGMNFGTAVEVARASTLFTTHTPVPAGHDTFSEDILRTYIPHYSERLSISWEDFVNLGRFNKGDQHEKFSMSVLAARLSQEMNGVSKIHGRVSREMFRGLYPGYFAEELHIGHVTNGVHFPTWTADNWKSFYASSLGDIQSDQDSDPSTWNNIHEIADAQVWEQRQKAKAEFLDFLRAKLARDMERRQENPKVIYQTLKGIDDNAIYIGFARRFATYKRAHLLFTDLEKLARLVNDEKMPLRFIFAGKAHPNDKPGQDLIKRIMNISKMPEFVGRIIFLENYDMSVGRQLVSGVDIWMNTPTRPMEASGTSGEKAVMNGVLNLSVLDGWWAEGYRKNAGWAIPEAKTYANQAFQDELDAEIIYRLLEDEVLPMYFDQNKDGYSPRWVEYIKNNIAGIAPHFTMRRMLNDYYSNFYSKLFDRIDKIRKNNYTLAMEIDAWKQHIRSQWQNIEVRSVKIPNSTSTPFNQGEEFVAEVVIHTNGIAPEHIGVDIVVGQKEFDRVNKVYRKKELELTKHGDEEGTWSCTMSLKESGVFDFAFRIFPKHEFLPHRQDFIQVKWI
jgi:phosphorylase/glycogen(starch) synthase